MVWAAPQLVKQLGLLYFPLFNADIDINIVDQKSTLIGIIARPQLQTESILESFKKA